MIRIKARTVLQLGSELISSDGVAFYELVKNAFDAGSPRANIDLVIRLAPGARVSAYAAIERELKSPHQPPSRAALATIKESLLAAIQDAAPGANELRQRIESAESAMVLRSAVDDADYIEISDTGSGMSAATLREAFLTIGTPMRLKERDGGQASIRPVLGEKGLGRLAAMRLGMVLQVSTSLSGERSTHQLSLDWRAFSEDLDAFLEDIPIAAPTSASKSDRDSHGTTLRISALVADWTVQRIQGIVGEEFSRFLDPFAEGKPFPISIRLNGEHFPIPRMDRILFEHAHATVRASYSVSGSKARFSGTIDYSLRKREHTFLLETPELLDIISPDPLEVLLSLGPFTVEFYWFNRQLLTAIDGIGTLAQVRQQQAQWAGGLSLYRDGFRVHPYGGPDDDWLDLDRKALASAGYKVNRRQLIGRVSISAKQNSLLVDQTNREGLRDSPAKRALVNILKHLLEVEFRRFLNKVDEEKQARIPVSFDELRGRVDTQQKNIRRGLRTLLEKYPHLKKETTVLDSIRDSAERIQDVLAEAEQLADSFQRGRSTMVHLAGLGLMLEGLAHELNRLTSHALNTLGQANRGDLPSRLSSHMTTLEAQLKTLSKRLRVLDPLSTAGRQRKESFDLLETINDVLAAHEAQFRRHAIRCTVQPDPKSASRIPVKLVRGMIIQILENLLSNAVYWLKQQKKLDSTFRSVISISVDPDGPVITVSDNGPGVLKSRAEEIFEPFVTTKPPGEGKGLGLYISREIARYHDATLAMVPPHGSSNRSSAFALTFGGDSRG